MARVLVGAVAVLLASSLLVVLLLIRHTAAMDQHSMTDRLTRVTLAHGPFRIEAQGRMVGSGTFPNQGPQEAMEVTGFSVYHRDRPIVVRHGERELARFWRASILADAPRPALLVSTQDFHLITEEGGTPVVRSVGEPSTNLAEYQWLDSDDGQPGEPAGFYDQKVRMDELPLHGGRYLLLQSRAVLDVQTLKVYSLTARLPHGDPLEGAAAGGRVLAFAPGRTQFVTWGRGYPSGEEGLVVTDFQTGDVYSLPLEKGQRRYDSPLSITSRWLAHYARWTKDRHGREQLVLTTPARPLPWYGRVQNSPYSESGKDGTLVRHALKSYALARAAPTLASVLEDFLVRRFGATVMPPEPGSYRRARLHVPDCTQPMRVEQVQRGETVDTVLRADEERADFVSCGDLVERIAAAFNAELERGMYQEHFVE